MAFSEKTVVSRFAVLNFLPRFFVCKLGQAQRAEAVSFKAVDQPDDHLRTTALFGATSAIRRALNLLPEGTIIATAQFLSFGSRAAVDKACSRLCRLGEIVRLARGLYFKVRSGDPHWRPPLEDIVMTKVRAFQRDAVPPPTEDPLSRKIPQRQPSSSESESRDSRTEIHLDTNGNTSSFRLYNGIVVRLKHVAMRKFDLAQAAVGRKLRVLCEAAQGLSPIHLKEFSQSIGREERKDLKVLLALLPHWLSDVLGAPWGHKWEIHKFPVRELSGGPAQWFSLASISHSRARRSDARPLQLDCCD
ncbi:MAG: hypothetical protein K2W95_10645 [Candidatus Obscuribacterales bacterium]|nr:hypothetical protein [Candidatus Obscuribacterales bacterium]